MSDNIRTDEQWDHLWRTTPIGQIAKQFIATDPENPDHLRAAQAADDFLYDLSADGPVIVKDGETTRLRPGHMKGWWVEVEHE